jgi:hypothetical protein
LGIFEAVEIPELGKQQNESALAPAHAAYPLQVPK